MSDEQMILNQRAYNEGKHSRDNEVEELEAFIDWMMTDNSRLEDELADLKAKLARKLATWRVRSESVAQDILDDFEELIADPGYWTQEELDSIRAKAARLYKLLHEEDHIADPGKKVEEGKS
jgi:ElaB/YqjD/DUF883 family membrane-anchored ribosome-binding protein